MFGRDTIAAFLEWVQRAGLWGAALFGLAYIPAAVLFVPAFGSTGGAAAAFVVARTVGHDWVVSRTATWPALDALTRAVESDAFKVVLLTRLSPLFPFNLLNYAFGLSSVPFTTYLLASWIGMLPGTIMYIYLGSAAQSVAALISGQIRRTPAQQVLFAIGLAATVVVTTLVTRTARRALRTIVPP